MRRIAVYGGSFNPPHVGHAMVAAWLRWTDQVDEVWLVPTFAHAFGKTLLPFEMRVACCDALGRTVGPWIRTETIESTLPVPSYTVDTLAALQARHPDDTFRLVVGADILPDTPKWKAWDRIVAHHPPILVGRGGYPPVEGAPTFPEVSSTRIRDALIEGTAVEALVPAEVLQVLKSGSAADILRNRSDVQ